MFIYRKLNMTELSLLRYNTFLYKGVTITLECVPSNQTHSYMYASIYDGSVAIESYTYINNIEDAIKYIDAYINNFPIFNSKEDFYNTELFYRSLDTPDIAAGKSLYKTFSQEDFDLDSDSHNESDDVMFWTNGKDILLTITKMHSAMLKRRFSYPEIVGKHGYTVLIFKNRMSVYRGYFYSLEEETINELKEVISNIC